MLCKAWIAYIYICRYEYMYVCECARMYLFLILNALILQIFENGKDTGEISVFISKKDLGSNSPAHTGDVMERVSLLTFIHDYKISSKLLVVNLNNYILKVAEQRSTICWSGVTNISGLASESLRLAAPVRS